MIEGKNLEEAFALFSAETKRLEQSYRALQSECRQLGEKLESIVTHLSEGLLFITLGGQITLFNPAAEALTGYTKFEVIGRPYTASFSDTFFGFSMKDALGGALRYQVAVIQLGSGKEIEVSASPAPGKGLTVFLRDITEVRRLKNALEQNDRLKELGEMAASLAHEIRNPLGGIEGFAALLLHDLEQSPHQQGMVRAIIDGTRALNHLVTSVLDYTRPLEPHLAPTDLDALIKETICLIQADRKNKHRFTFESVSSPYVIAIDRNLIRRALLNLLHNAASASPRQPEILVRLKEGGVIEVIDRGIGIERDDLGKIFTPFFTTKTTGTGLGLAEVHKIIEAHGGTIEVDSKRNRGTTFRMKVCPLNES